MKTLLVMRHAKSDHEEQDQTDHDRPLEQRGRVDAPKMGEFLTKKDMVPNYILASSAVRARETAKLVAKGCGFKGECDLKKELYLAPAKAYIDTLKALKTEAERVLIVGHNPGLEELLQHLTGNTEHMPTAAIARVTLAINAWKEFGLKTRGKLMALWLPRELE